MKQRIQKLLSARGVCSRRHAEQLIEQGRVTCNGAVCSLGDSADPDVDVLLVDGKPLPAMEKQVYIMLHKPKGYVTTMCDEKGRRNVSELVADCGCRVYPVGRLDMDSEGLLLMTNDGEFANKMMHPSHEVDKTYLVTVKKLTREGLDRLQRPMTLDGYRLRLPKVRVVRLPDGDSAIAQLEITIHEGRNRQVRRMCAIAGMQVVRLLRIREGSLSMGQLPAGKWRPLTDDEVDLLLH